MQVCAKMIRHTGKPLTFHSLMQLLRLLFLPVLAICCAFLPNSLNAADRPNILWITTEDIGPQLACYGDIYAQTPNLDAFAAKGQMFLKAWSNAPVCAPARTTIISGMYPTSTGSEHMRSSVPMPAGAQLYPTLLRAAGYYCTNNAKTDYNLQAPDELWDESSKKAHWKNRKDGQPFFAVFNFETTHESQIRKPGHTLKHDPAKAPVPPYHPDTPEVRHDWAQYYDNITTMDGQFQEKLDELKAAGLDDNTIVFFYGDHGAGMPRSKRWPYNSGLRVPLIVKFPDKWKHLAPKGYASGAKSSEMVSFVDLAPTLLSIVAAPKPAYLQGRAFCGAKAEPEPGLLFGFRGRMDEKLDLVRSVTDGRFVYLRQYMPHLPYGQYLNYMMQMPTAQVSKKLYDEGKLNEVQRRFWEPKPAEELYDLQNDPWEIKNLAGDSAHADTLKNLREAHAKHCKDIRDVGFIPEAERLRIAGKASPRDAFAKDDAYPFDEVFALAGKASMPAPKDAEPFLKALKHANPVVRYWGVMGLHIHPRGLSTTQLIEALRPALVDESPSVRIAAAGAIGLSGSKEDVAESLEVLLAEADVTRSSLPAAIEALNAIAAYGPEAVKPVEARLKALPQKSPEVDKRLSEYVPRLLEATLAP